MNRILIVIAFVTLVIAGVVAGVAAAGYDRHSDSLHYPTVTRIVLDHTRGEVTITRSGVVSGVAVKRTTTTLFAKATQSAYVRNGVLHLDSRCDHTLCGVDYRIAAPVGVRVQVIHNS
jgi:hypothetical protein